MYFEVNGVGVRATLQKELLNFYALEPSAEKMEKLKDFMFQLFLAEAKQLEHPDKSEKGKMAA